MTADPYNQLISLLIDIECEMRRASLWSVDPPSAEAMASVEPFCVDTMGFDAWLQFVFLPRMHELLTTEPPLPIACDIAAMAETVWAANTRTKNVIHVLRVFDQAISQT
jgi:uncharacterized protein YqcC (DUF446 family)